MLLRNIATIAGLFLGSVTLINSARAVEFSHAELDQGKIVAIASPYGDNQHQLLIVEQISAGRLCWSEKRTETGMVIINPLLGEFDFTGICRRSTDSNGYSVRLNNQDLGWKYGLKIMRRENDLLLVAVSTTRREAHRLVVGRTKGNSGGGFVKIHLNPGWRMTRRAFKGQVTGHIYLTHDQPLTVLEKTDAL
jgi:hypothetical protein